MEEISFWASGESRREIGFVVPVRTGERKMSPEMRRAVVAWEMSVVLAGRRGSP